MKIIRKAGDTSNILQIFIQDSSSTIGAGLTGLVFNSGSLTAYYHKDTDTTATAITLVTMTVGTVTSSGFKEIDATNMPGWYQFCPPDAAFSTSGSPKTVGLHLKGATNMAPLAIECQLIAADLQDTVRLGLTAMPNVASGSAGAILTSGTGTAQLSVSSGLVTLAASQPGVTIPTVTTVTNQLTAAQIATGVWTDTTAGDFTTALSVGKSLMNGVALGTGLTVNDITTKTGYSLSGTQTFNVTGSITGNLSGSVGSVTGAVGSVTGAVGSVTGSVGSVATGGITRASLAADTGLQTIRSNTAQAGASTSLTLDASASATNSFYNNCLCYLTGGTGAGQSRFVTGYVGSTKVATVNSAWATTPDNTTTFAIVEFDAIPGATAPTAAQVATAVWQDTTAGDFTVSASIGKSVMNGVALGTGLTINDLTTKTGFSLSGTQTFNVTGNITGNLSGSVGSVTGAVGSVTGAVGSVTGAVGSVTGNVGGNVTGTVGSVVGAVGSIASGGISRASYAADTGMQSVRSNTAQAGASTTITLDASASASNSFYNNCLCYITGGTGVGQARFITGYVGATKVATVNSAWVTNPDSSSTFAVIAFDAIPGATAPTAAQVATAVWQDTTAGDFTVASSIGKSLYTSGNAPGAASGLALVGSNMGTITGALTGAQIATAVWTDTTAGDFTTALSIGKSVLNGVTLGTGLTVNDITTKTGYSLSGTQTFNVTGNITGNLSGSVGSVTGAVGSVTGAVGSVTGSVGSVTGAVGSVTGNVGGNVVGSVASVTARVTANTDQVSGNATAASNVSHSMQAITRGTCSGGTLTTAVVSALTSPSSLGAAGQLIGRTILFDANTVTANLQGQASNITNSTTGSTPTLTFTALTTAPVSGDTFSVL
jgi:hypothetical protein